MDTVSQIRGNQGRPPLPEKDRIYFMKQKLDFNTPGKFNQIEPLKFQYDMAATSQLPLIDAYIGVDFSIVYEVIITLRPKNSGLPLIGRAQHYCKVPGGGIDPALGRSFKPQDFVISSETLSTPTQKLPKFKFTGKIYSTNCCYTDPFQGHVICDASELQIKSIEIQLVRAETFEGKTNATEVQNI